MKVGPTSMKSKVVVKGFTLLEILLVVLIISIMTVVGSNLINSQSVERQVMNQAQKFSNDLTFICEKAVLENQAYGLELYKVGYQVLQHQQTDWVLVDSQISPVIQDGIEMELIFGGLSENLAPEAATEDLREPHIICQTDGSFNVFELRFNVAAELSDAGNDSPSYAISTQTPWQLKGAWYQP